MTTEKLLAELGARNIRLRRKQDELVLIGNKEALEPSLISQVRSHKAFLLGLIGNDPSAVLNPGVRITPEMVTLVEMTQEEIDAVVGQVPGGVANVQDIYPLAPLQEGILFHHLLESKGDPYVLGVLMRFASRERLEKYLQAVQWVVDRHDILRTAIVWEGVREPVQVVWRNAVVGVEEVELGEEGDAGEKLYERFHPRRVRMDVKQAPMLRAVVAQDRKDGSWLMMRLVHHLIGDHYSMDVMQEEILMYMSGRQAELPEAAPFRELLAQMRLGESRQEQERYFREMLGEVKEATAPFGLMQVQGDGKGIEEATLQLQAGLLRRIRERGRKLRVSAAVLFHLAWACVVARTSGRKEAVFGTVLFGQLGRGTSEKRVMGVFINTLPVRIEVGGDGIEEAVRKTQRVLAEVARHEHASLVLAQRCSGVAAPQPLFTSLLNYRHIKVSRAKPNEAHEWEGINNLRGEERSNYPISLSINDSGNHTSVTAQTDASIDPMRICRFMYTAMESLVEALETAPFRRISSIDVMTAAEREQILYGWNDTAVQYEGNKCIHEIFEEQVSKSPDAIAVVHEGASLSYGELNRRANQLAHYLRKLGVQPDTRVGICVERGLEMVIGILAILKAGGGYVPLDPAYPSERLLYMLEDSVPVVLLTQAHLREQIGQLSATLPKLDLTHDEALWQGEKQSNPERADVGFNCNHLAYVIYTSGSTGQPKGVLIEHANVVRLFAATDHWCHFNENDVWTLFHSYAFDFSVWELWGALLYGGLLLVVPRDIVRSADDFYRLVCEKKVTVLNQTPSAFRHFMAAQVNSEERHRLRYVIFGGEALEMATLRPWYQNNQRCQTQLVNMYGITETTVHVTYRPLDAHDTEVRGGSPIGSRIPDLKIYILDEHLEATPVRVKGELYVGGAGVARGYLNRPELTGERFLPDPYSMEAGVRMYKTGDVGRWLADGSIEFLGRNDGQIKIRGYRIELGEIEARLMEHSALREAVVVMREDVSGEKRLVAYYLTEQGEEGQEEGRVGAEQLRRHLALHLPEYMVPAAYVRMQELPLTANGKLDRKALPSPEEDAYAVSGYEEPQGEIERALAEIWANVLELERVGRSDNFFTLGGHSLLAMLVVSRSQQRFRVKVALKDLFMQPELAEFGRVVASAIKAELPPITRVERDEGLPLSYAQQRLWFLYQLEPGSCAHNVTYALRLKGPINRPAVEGTISEIVRRHEVLRTTFAQSEAGPVQIIHPHIGFVLASEDLSHLPAAEREGAMRSRAQQEANRPFDLLHGPVFRARILQLGSAEHVVVLAMHHIVCDGWSEHILLREFTGLYSAFCSGKPSPLPELEKQYCDFAVWQRNWLEGPQLAQQRDYWKTALRSIQNLKLPLDRQGGDVTYASRLKRFKLTTESTQKIKQLSHDQDVTLFMLCIAAFHILLGWYANQDDVITGTDVANRTLPEIEGLIGFFVNQLVLRSDLSGDPSFSELLERVRTTTLGAYSHQDFPFEKLVEELSPDRTADRNPLFNVKLVLQNTPSSNLLLPGLETELIPIAPSLAKHLLLFTLREHEGTLRGVLEYPRDLFEDNSIELLASLFQEILNLVVRDPSIRLSVIRRQLDTLRESHQSSQRSSLQNKLEQRLAFTKRKAVSPA